MIMNILSYPGAFAVLIAATVIDLAAVGIAFYDFFKKEDKE